MDTTNDYFVGVQGDSIVVMMPVVGLLSKDRALRLAAYLVAMADDTGDEFAKVLDAVQGA